MESNGRRRILRLSALLAALILVIGACKSGGGDGEGTGEGEEGGGGTPVATGGDPFSLAAGFAQMSVTGRSGGNTDASSHGDECVGSIASSADHAMTVTGSVTAHLAVTPETEGDDTTLVILGPGGPYCNDDHEGFNPGLTATFAAGEYQVFVGNYDPEAGGINYTLTVSPAQAEGTPGGDPGTDPTTAPGGAAPGGAAPGGAAPGGAAPGGAAPGGAAPPTSAPTQ